MFSALFIYVLCLVDFGAKSFDRTEEKIINGNLRVCLLSSVDPRESSDSRELPGVSG